MQKKRQYKDISRKFHVWIVSLGTGDLKLSWYFYLPKQKCFLTFGSFKIRIVVSV